MSFEHGQQFLDALSTINQDLPFSPALLTMLHAKLGDGSSAPLDEIAAAIGRDQALTAKVLALANSAFYGLQAQVTTVSRAVTVLGLREIRLIVTALAVHSLTIQHKPHPEFDLQAYWRHQLLTAAAARLIGQQGQGTGGVDAESLFTAGLLHDLGKLLTAMHAGQEWRAIADLAAGKAIPYAKAEEEHWGIEHGVIGAMVLDRWNLPVELTEPVNWHHSPELAPEFATQANLLRVADAAAHRFEAPDHPQDLDLDAELARLAIPWEALEQEFLALERDGALGSFIRDLGQAA